LSRIALWAVKQISLDTERRALYDTNRKEGRMIYVWYVIDLDSGEAERIGRAFELWSAADTYRLELIADQPAAERERYFIAM
jgi:hypothetical protein